MKFNLVGDMKKLIRRLALFLVTLTALAQASEQFVPCEKIYLQQDQVVVTQGGIFCCLNEQWVATEALFCDASGLYVTSMRDERSIYWTCPKCKEVNSPLRNSCKRCGYGPDKD